MEPFQNWRGRARSAGPSRCSIRASLAPEGLAPIAYGTIADHSDQTLGIIAAALTAAAIIPMVLALRPFLHEGHDRTGGTMIIKQKAGKEAPSLVAVPEILLAGIRTNVQLTASSAIVFRRGINTS